MRTLTRPAAAAEPRTQLASATWSLFLAIAFLMLGNSLQGAIVGVRSQTEGFGVQAGGLIMAAYFAGFLVGSRYALHLLAQVGHIRVFAALASTASAVVLMHSIIVSPVPWVLFRFVFGLCMSGIYVVAESWLNDMATNATRGRLLSVYMLVTMGGMALGQFLFNVADPGGSTLFILASVLVSFAVVPIALSASSAPPVTKPVKMPLRELLSIVPSGVVTSFCVGAAAGAILGIGPVYAAQVGMSNARISLFLAAPTIGAVITQWPIGWLSDRVSRRGVITGVSLVAAVVALIPVWFNGPNSPALLLTMLLLGMCVFPLYSLSVAYTNDWLEQERIVGASGTLIRVNGTGAIVGPLLAATLMNLAGVGMMFWTIAGAHFIIAAYVSYRIAVVEAMPADQQRSFIPIPGRASELSARLVPSRKRDGNIDLVQHRRSEHFQADQQDGN